MGVSGTQPWITRLRLADFRNYERLDIAQLPRLVALAGPNGAGKTNILEAVSMLGPGRGLRRATLPVMARHAAQGFSILADLEAGEETVLLATGVEPGETQRQVRIDREPVSGAIRFLDYLALLWLTPDQDGLFRGPAGDRRRFLDRLVLAVDPAHAARASAYENALRHRNRLLEEGTGGVRWFEAIEQEIVELGVSIAAARRETVNRLAALMVAEAEEMAPFPFAELALEGAIEDGLAAGTAAEVEDRFRQSLRDGRERDRAAGRTLTGPHTSDLAVRHGPKGEAAALCSTGEQKALLIGLVLAQARLITQMRGRAPILLLDEIAAHLDGLRRAALYATLDRLGGQVFMTGTDAALFEALGPGGGVFGVEDGRVTRR